MIIQEFVKEVLLEDIGRGDLFGRVAPKKEATAQVIAKSEGIVAGEPYLEALAQFCNLELYWHKRDGEAFGWGDVILKVMGDAADLLAAERTLLNMLLHASSIATQVQPYIKALEGTNVLLLDTRKTRPMLRNFEKYAVRVGGAVNHRMGLDDALMLKDTHLSLIDDLEAFIERARRKIPFTTKIEIECESVDAAAKAMDVGADIVMCDNMQIAQIREVVLYRNENYPGVLLEASGNITLENIREVALTGVDAISSGSIIHQSRWIDLSMKIVT
ncbi:carboxylating nicotinate-nucleotide diphosphorylase [Hydrogenimonas cancrithermarum]|uniref:nicotinate-nucleotide diphosphorylase (carboxylating) n=1 Tax=Hydrogenimonas cancrithermarum TaxID=2993563 RepID=A0ABN6WUZ9_9BACT|nr:carboxylating nicotinate-nucleotide diphosphorylase [Hydrogenimonas cancrithermarum]BDY12554.1 putative nicotinate-nucleotide pyrophosphorylase [carboxylating] [Hydrogenimonas cancrithermarum]